MKQFAIFNYSGKSPNKGGPIGYLYHLYSGFIDDKPDFLSIVQSDNTNVVKHVANHSFVEKITFLYEFKCIVSFIKKGLIVRKKYKNNINNYKLLHIHESESVFYLLLFARYKGKIVLTSHRPESLADEIVNAVKVKHKGSFKLLYSLLVWIEKYSYKKADAFIFPSEHAANIYSKFPGFSQYSEGKPFKYLITGLNYKKPTCSKSDYFIQHDIKLNPEKSVVSYIGRHNYIKGYDRVVNSFNVIKRNDACVLVAGAPGSIEYPKDSNWVELGYINDAMNLMKLADVIVIPNRNTYFDLVIIEALSLGKIVVSSNTGGNIDIAKECAGLVLFDNQISDSCSLTIERILKMDLNERAQLEKQSRQYYERHCTPQIFASNYKKIITEIKNIL